MSSSELDPPHFRHCGKGLLSQCNCHIVNAVFIINYITGRIHIVRIYTYILYTLKEHATTINFYVVFDQSKYKILYFNNIFNTTYTVT